MLNLFKKKSKTDQMRILVVDDEPDLASTIQCRLAANNYDVITASNGKEGLEKAQSAKPDLILLDNNMPVMTGLEMLEQLRDHPELKNMPVIMLTALCEANDIAAVSAYGISDYVTKPCDHPAIMEKIAHALKT